MPFQKYSYIGISLIILIFGIYTIPKIIGYFKNPVLTIIQKVPEFEFTNQNNERITNAFYKNKVYVVEFFFTTCTTICPIMNEHMVKIQNEFYGHPNFGIASFTINPIYDTPEILKKYAQEIGANSKNWNFLTGPKEHIYALSNTGFSLYAGENSQTEDGFEHSGLFALIDKKGFIRSREDDFGNPIAYYDGLDPAYIKMLIDDIEILLKEK